MSSSFYSFPHSPKAEAKDRFPWKIRSLEILHAIRRDISQDPEDPRSSFSGTDPGERHRLPKLSRP